MPAKTSSRPSRSTTKASADGARSKTGKTTARLRERHPAFSARANGAVRADPRVDQACGQPARAPRPPTPEARGATPYRPRPRRRRTAPPRTLRPTPKRNAGRSKAPSQPPSAAAKGSQESQRKRHVDRRARATSVTATQDRLPATRHAAYDSVPPSKRKEVQRLLEVGATRGFLTYDEVNDALTPGDGDVRADRRPDGAVRPAQHRGRRRGVAGEPARKPAPAAAESARATASLRRRATPSIRRCRRRRSTRTRCRSRATRSACTCARWARSRCSRARARSRSPSASRRREHGVRGDHQLARRHRRDPVDRRQPQEGQDPRQGHRQGLRRERREPARRRGGHQARAATCSRRCGALEAQNNKLREELALAQDRPRRRRRPRRQIEHNQKELVRRHARGQVHQEADRRDRLAHQGVRAPRRAAETEIAEAERARRRHHRRARCAAMLEQMRENKALEKKIAKKHGCGVARARARDRDASAKRARRSAGSKRTWGSRSTCSSRPTSVCTAASARPRRPRPSWSRPTCASSSRSPRSTRTAACSSWT